MRIQRSRRAPTGPARTARPKFPSGRLVRRAAPDDEVARSLMRSPVRSRDCRATSDAAAVERDELVDRPFRQRPRKILALVGAAALGARQRGLGHARATSSMLRRSNQSSRRMSKPCRRRAAAAELAAGRRSARARARAGRASRSGPTSSGIVACSARIIAAVLRIGASARAEQRQRRAARRRRSGRPSRRVRRRCGRPGGRTPAPR